MIGYYFELLTSETMHLLGSTKSKITENKNGEKVPNLEITEVVLVHCNIVNDNCKQKSGVSIHLFQINRLVNY